MNGIRMTDEELTRAYQTYCNMVYRIAFVQTKSQAQAEDIQQDVFMALVRYSDRIRSEEHLKAWLIRVTQNACRKHFRSLWIKLTVLYDDTLYKEQETESDGMAVAAEPSGGDPADSEEVDVVREAVEQLPPNSRAVIHLFYYEEMSLKEIAFVTESIPTTVASKLSRTRKKICKIIKMLQS